MMKMRDYRRSNRTKDTRAANRPGVILKTDKTPAEYNGATETCRPLLLHPPIDGSVFRCVELCPKILNS